MPFDETRQIVEDAVHSAVRDMDPGIPFGIYDLLLLVSAQTGIIFDADDDEEINSLVAATMDQLLTLPTSFTGLTTAEDFGDGPRWVKARHELVHFHRTPF